MTASSPVALCEFGGGGGGGGQRCYWSIYAADLYMPLVCAKHKSLGMRRQESVIYLYIKKLHLNQISHYNRCSFRN